MPDRLIGGKAHEPAEQQVVLELLHEHPLAADGIQHLQQQRPQQPFRGMDLLPSWLQISFKRPSSAFKASSAIARTDRNG